MNGLQCLIKWLKQVQEEGEPKIPYTYHDLIHLFHDNWGLNKSIEVLEKLDKYSEDDFKKQTK